MILDLISAYQPQGNASSWTPAQLFQNGEIGMWLDAGDYSTMFQDSAGTTPITAVGQPVGLWKNKIAGQPGFDITSTTTAAARPVTGQNNGKRIVRYDGIDDYLRSVSNNTTVVANTGLTLAIGQYKAVNESRVLFEIENSTRTVNISNLSSGTVRATMGTAKPQSVAVISNSTFNTIVAYADNSNSSAIRLNGVVATSDGSGLSTVMARPAVVGEPVNDCDINQVLFINRVLTPAEITLLEAYIASH